MREPLDGSLWLYWIAAHAADAAKKNGACFKNYHRFGYLFYLCRVQKRQRFVCNMRDFLRGLNEFFAKLCQYGSYTEPSFQEIHLLLQHNSSAHKSLDASSAGLEPISTYLAAILFATKVWNLLSRLAMSVTTSNSCYMIRFNLLVTTTVYNANRGLVTYFLGVCLDFPMRNEQ